jgi:hypothetical protein
MSAYVIARSLGIFFDFVSFQDENGVGAGGFRLRIALG